MIPVNRMDTFSIIVNAIYEVSFEGASGDMRCHQCRVSSINRAVLRARCASACEKVLKKILFEHAAPCINFLKQAFWICALLNQKSYVVDSAS